MRLVKPSFEILAAYGHDDRPYSYDRPELLVERAARTCYQSAGNVAPGSAEKMVAMLRARGHLAMLEHSWEVRKAPMRIEYISPYLHHKNGFISGNKRAWQEVFGDDSFGLEMDNPLSLSQIIESPFHAAMTVSIVCDRGVSHEIVRHRVAGYAQESSRFCNYSLGEPGAGIATIMPFFFDASEPGISDKEFNRRDSLYRIWDQAMQHAEDAYMALIELGATPQQARTVLPISLKTELVITAHLAEWQHIFRLRCAKDAHPQMREIMLPLREEARKLYPGVFDGSGENGEDAEIYRAPHFLCQKCGGKEK